MGSSPWGQQRLGGGVTVQMGVAHKYLLIHIYVCYQGRGSEALDETRYGMEGPTRSSALGAAGGAFLGGTLVILAR